MTGPGSPPSRPGTAQPGRQPYGQGAARLSPLVLLIDPIRMLPSLFLPLMGVLVAGGFSPTSFGWAAFGVAGSVLYAVIRWVTFTYSVTADRVELTRAFVGRSVRTIPLERIRGVDITTPPLHRLLGLAVLKIDTGAGGGDAEGELDGLTMGEAERLRAVLLSRGPAALPHPQGSLARDHAGSDMPSNIGSNAGSGAGPGVPAFPAGTTAAHVPIPAAHVPEQVHARVPRSWLRYGPLSGAYLLTPFALAAGAVGLVFQWGDELGLTERNVRRAVEWVWAHPVLPVAVVVVLVLAMPLAGGIAYAIFNWDFSLRSRDGYLIAERGLVTRRAVSLELRRIRGYELVDGLIERWVGVVRLWAVVTGLGDSQTRGQLLPVTPRKFAAAVASEVIGPLSAPLRPHPPRARRRRLFRAVAPWLVTAAVALALGWAVVTLAALALAAVGIPLGLDRYRSLGHAYDGTRLSVRSGSLRRAQAVVERRAIVGWTVRQTLFQRSSGVLTVVAGVGAGSGGYLAIDTGEAQGVEFAAEVTPDWIRPFLSKPPS
ncbi:PH domain-containing protein [Planotetraspora sp. A-T 1434]|uniref:PH domain-containing protein n=1 Tax=Planotetraspora sp. A-T 1434 TaxID=2979219 RepID=UPI0021C037B6|nr:PH domain-containing protein [Planotetraspora sp. A-T 1434]MCT9929536.1 PH domain-containing protein [Planotetraspora sp. A-T 1434]